MSSQLNTNEHATSERDLQPFDGSQTEQQSQLGDSSSWHRFNERDLLQSTATNHNHILPSLPESSDDLFVPIKYIYFAVQIYENLHRICKLNIELEDFCAALSANDSNASVSGIVADIHIGLLQILSKQRVDNFTWPKICELYAMNHKEKMHHQLLTKIGHLEYQSIGINDRLQILGFLVEQFLESATYRKGQETINCTTCSNESESVDSVTAESFRCDACQGTFP